MHKNILVNLSLLRKYFSELNNYSDYDQFRLNVIFLFMISGEDAQDFSNRFGLVPSTIVNWNNKFRSTLLPAVSKAESDTIFITDEHESDISMSDIVKYRDSHLCLNVEFERDNIGYVKRVSRLKNKTISEHINKLINNDKSKNGHIFDKIDSLLGQIKD